MNSEQVAYRELCCYTIAHRDASFMHQHVVDAFTAQSANERTQPIALTSALVGLYLHVEKRFSGRQVPRAHMRLALQKRPWPVLGLPGFRAVSASLRAETKRAMPVARDISVIPNFIDAGVYRRRADSALRTRFAPPGEPLVIHLFNLRPVKQVDAVVRVFAQIAARVSSRLLIVGEGPDLGPAEQLIEELGLGAQVELIGEVQDVVGLLSISDLFLLPSLQESFGLSALEAMACGVLVVASNVGGLPEVVTDGVTGFLHPPDDLSRMAESALRILSDPELHVRMAADGARLATERFSTDRIVPQHEALYEQALSRS